jgi:hypothetical protein
MKGRTVWLIAFCCLWVSLFSSTCPLEAASVIRVPADQQTIQSAIAAASDGDVVQVAAGTYIENLNFLGKAIRVRSEQGPDLTIIDGNGAGPVVTFLSGESRQSVLNGFTVRNGANPVGDADGGGIRIVESSPTVSGNIITNNSYTIVATASDLVGNTTTVTATCSVPKDVDPTK